ncbi:GNAT family N-acetyltransferase [Microtetraspora fusca]|uniref:GNAT family N-acetyltransferase n=1 Tax=Microtetraspora fusca TaxID=1997 RepID=UPI00082B3B8F|nr:GNAT family N-acetyltransferase [Microtetraspora fusca]
MHIVSRPDLATPTELLIQVRDLQQEAWPSYTFPAPGSGEPNHDPALHPLSMLLVDDDIVVAALDILSKEITHHGRRYRAAGLSTVVTRKAARGRGHGRTLITAARTAMADAGFDIGLFTCDRPLQAFYESGGWQPLPATVLIGGTPEEPFPSDQPGFDKVTMADFFSVRSRQHRPSFHQARIELYPGLIDKLW